MWYLIKDVGCDMFSVRYYKSTNQTPTVLLVIYDGDYIWNNDIISFTGLYNTNKGFTNLMSIDEMAFDGSYNIIPLPGISSDITSIAPIIEAYPELLI